jgi:hypothetical protein
VLAGRSFHLNAASEVRLARAGEGGEAQSPALPVPPLARVR